MIDDPHGNVFVFAYPLAKPFACIFSSLSAF